MSIFQKHYNNTIRSSVISKHLILNSIEIPSITKSEFKLKTNLKKQGKIWVLLFWTITLFCGQKPSIKKIKESSAFNDVSYLFVFTVSFSRKNMFFFLSKYINFLTPKIESTDTIGSYSRDKSYSIFMEGYLNYFESIEIFNFLGNNELYLINHLKFELTLFFASEQKQRNLTILRSFQLPISK